MVAVEDEEVVAGCVAALAEDAYDMVEVEVAGVVDGSEEDDKDEDEDEDEEGDDSDREEEEEEEGKEEEVAAWPDGTE